MRLVLEPFENTCVARRGFVWATSSRGERFREDWRRETGRGSWVGCHLVKKLTSSGKTLSGSVKSCENLRRRRNGQFGPGILKSDLVLKFVQEQAVGSSQWTLIDTCVSRRLKNGGERLGRRRL